MQAAEIRAQAAASQLAGLLAQSTQQRVGELYRTAAHPAVRAFLQHSTEALRETATLK